MGVGDRLRVRLSDLPTAVLAKGEVILTMVKFNSPERGKFEIQADKDIALEIIPASGDIVSR